MYFTVITGTKFTLNYRLCVKFVSYVISRFLNNWVVYLK